MTSDAPIFYAANANVVAISRSKALGLTWILYGVFRIAVTLWLMAFTTTATVMFGALLTRVPDPFSLMNLFHIFYLGVIVWSAVSGVLSIVAGLALLAGQRSARVLAIFASLLSLSELPVGIALGVYTLVHALPAPPATPYVTAATGP
jgi:hypothetical protein